MRILLLGGTGAIGNNLKDLLLDNNIEVVVTSRTKGYSLRNVRYITGNAKDIAFLLPLLQECWDAIVDFMVYTTKEFEERVNLLLEYTSQYIFLSSARVYANSNVPISEKSPRLLDVSKDKDFLDSDEYSLTKAKQENILKKSGKTNWTIIRPYITYSSQRLQLGTMEKEDWLYRALKGRTIIFCDDINSRLTTMTYGFDVAKGIASLIGNNNSFGEIYHITSTKTLKWDKVLDIYLTVLEKHLGYKPKILLVTKDSFQTYHPATYQIIYDRLFDREFDNTKLSKYVDIKKFTTPEEGLKKCLEDFLKNPTFRNINWRAEALKDRDTKHYVKLSEIQGFKQKMKYLLCRLLIK